MKNSLEKIVRLALSVCILLLAVAGILFVLDVFTSAEAREFLVRSVEIIGIVSAALAVVLFILHRGGKANGS
jgi:hypothetical protein